MSDQQTIEKLCGRKLSRQEAFEAEQDLLAAFTWLWEMDKKYHPELYQKEQAC